MMRILEEDREALLEANKKDLDAFDRDDQALYDRLVMDSAKIDGMIRSVGEVLEQDDPVNREISRRTVSDGLEVINRTAPFGTILIIYESRPDVTVEAAVLAFKSNNKILLKGGKEAYHSNVALVACWHKALEENDLSADWIRMLKLDRLATRGDQRGRGLAQALLVDAFGIAAEHGAVGSSLSTDSRTGALGLYEKVGMVVTQTWVNRAIAV